MGLADWIGGFFRSEAKGMSSLDLFREIYGSKESRSGVKVGWKEALDEATVQACVRVLCNGVAQVPFPLMQEAGGMRVKATDHPAFKVFQRPNAYQTSFALRETIMLHLALTGNAFVWKGLVGRNRELRALEPIDPAHMTVTRERDGTLLYKVTANDGAAQIFTSAEIWHIRGPSWAPWLGMDAVKLARDAIGLAIATEQAHADFHKGNARVSGLLAMDGTLGKEKFESLGAWLDRHSDGGDRVGKPIILDMGAKYTPFGMTGVDAEHLATRMHQIGEICRAFGVIPLMVGQSDKTATYASAEQMFLAHVVHTLSPWYARIEQSADAELLTEADRAAGYYFKFMANGLMRGAAKDRAEFYAKALGSGSPGTAWMTPNEARALEDMDPIEGGDDLPTGAPPVPEPADATDAAADATADPATGAANGTD